MWTALEGVTVASRYELRAHLATGGMAAVFRGWDHRLCRPVAVKVLRQLENADPSAIERFRREARSTAALQSPYIVEVYDFLRDDGCYYLVMELVEGVNLKERLAIDGPLAPEEAFSIAIQVCYALQAAHAHGFIHRDIKPQNILLDSSGLAKLADFGIVHIAQVQGFTTSGMVLGTADYISPEQAQGEPLAPTTDVYSLGVVLYEMLTAVLPFEGTTPVAVALRHATAPVPPLRSIRPEIPPLVERVVMRVLAKDPTRRYPSARAMAAAMEQALATLGRAGASPEETEGLVQYVHPIVGRTQTDEWRMLAERLREREAVTTPVAMIEPAEDAVATHVGVHAASISIPQVAPSPWSVRLAPLGHAPSHWTQRLLVTCGVALILLLGILVLHLLA